MFDDLQCKSINTINCEEFWGIAALKPFTIQFTALVRFSLKNTINVIASYSADSNENFLKRNELTKY